MEIRQLTYFVKAAETLHFTRASEEVFITQSTLSQQIKLLEGELGVLLFDRIRKQVRLTDPGKLLLTFATRILEDVKNAKHAMNELSNLVKGELKIGVTYSFTSLILPALSSFTEKYPGIKLYVEYGTPEEMERKLKLSQLDLVLAFHDPLDDKNFNMQLLLSSRIVMAISKKNPLNKLKKIKVKDLDKFELILPGKGFSSRDFLEELFSKYKLSPVIRMELNDVPSLLNLVEKGRWATIINEQALINWNRLIAIPIIGKEFLKPSYLLWQKGAFQKLSAKLFSKELIGKGGN